MNIPEQLEDSWNQLIDILDRIAQQLTRIADAVEEDLHQSQSHAEEQPGPQSRIE